VAGVVRFNLRQRGSMHNITSNNENMEKYIITGDRITQEERIKN
jgi:hypothetical protein